LFVGPAEVGKRTAALLFAQAINCEHPETGGCGSCRQCTAIIAGSHPDVRVWDVPEGEKTFKVEQVRELLHAVAFHPYQGRRKVHILAALDAIGPAGANALLKTLEEPPPSTVLVLLATSLETVLPTLISRCQVVPFGLMPVEAIAEALTLRRGVDPASAMAIAFQSQGRIGRAFSLAEQMGPTESGAGAPPVEAPALPGARDALAWSDAMAAKPEPEQKAALDELLTLLRDTALVATGAEDQPLRHGERARALAPSESVRTWLDRARRVEEARERLERHANAKLVFDDLARALAGDVK
jgi:DNA polymerase-3 subunit delta'